jgi:hypothetical protein
MFFKSEPNWIAGISYTFENLTNLVVEKVYLVIRIPRVVIRSSTVGACRVRVTDHMHSPLISNTPKLPPSGHSLPHLAAPSCVRLAIRSLTR